MAQVQKSVDKIVTAALNLHQEVATTFLPTAIKFHYIFNLRDLSNIFQVRERVVVVVVVVFIVVIVVVFVVVVVVVVVVVLFCFVLFCFVFLLCMQLVLIQTRSMYYITNCNTAPVVPSI